jgi:hypothetical protein
MLGRLALPSLMAQALLPTLAAPLIDVVPASWSFAGLALVATAGFACLLPFRRYAPVRSSARWGCPPAGRRT